MSKSPKIMYRTVMQKDGSYGVEVSRPGTLPSVVTSFATEAEADAWAARQQQDALDVNQRAKSIVDRVTRED